MFPILCFGAAVWASHSLVPTGIILGLDWGCIGMMANNMETTIS